MDKNTVVGNPKKGTATSLATEPELGRLYLLQAAGVGDLDRCRILLNAGVNPGEKGRRNQTPLMMASAEGHLAFCRMLVERGARLDA